MTAPTSSLPAASEANLRVLVANDVTIRRYRAQIAKEMAKIREIRQRITVANGAIRAQTNFLKRQNAEFLRELSGVQAVPGHQPPKETPRRAQARIKREYEEAMRAAQAVNAEASQS